MKALTALLGLLLAAFAGGRGYADTGTRNDINPALLYWQAFALLPDYNAQGYLFTNEWRGRALDSQFAEQIQSYDSRFKLLIQAAAQKAPCDWGYDLTQGPELLLPGLAKVKHYAQAARLRARWHLENGRQEAAREELAAAFALARQSSRGGVLIGALVQIASENILTSGIAENWFRFTPETLKHLVDDIDAGPARGLAADCVAAERVSLCEWMTRRVKDIQTTSGSEAEAMEKTRAMLRQMLNPGESENAVATPTPEQIMESAGNSTAGLLARIKEMSVLYDEAETLMRTPYAQFLPGIKAFDKKIANHDNQLVRLFFPAFEKCRLREFKAEVKQAMLHAAIAYRLSGAAGLASVRDPMMQQPFQFRRFVFNGVDRGFELRSLNRIYDWPVADTLIFLEKDGPAFNLDGPSAGKPVK